MIFALKGIFMSENKKTLTAERFINSKTGIEYRFVLSDTEYFRLHDHDFYEVFLILSGEAIHIVNGARIPLMSGDTVFIRPGDIHTYALKNEKRFTMLNITFTAETFRLLREYLGSGFDFEALLTSSMPPSVHISGDEQKRFEVKTDDITAIDANDTLRLQTRLRILLFEIFTRHFAKSNETKSDAPLWLSELRSLMQESHNFRGGSERLFSLTDRSREHVCRSMKKYFNETVSEFINGQRLNYVANMLQKSNMSVTDILLESGFNNTSWATECFKKKYGMTMSEYRKRTAE